MQQRPIAQAVRSFRDVLNDWNDWNGWNYWNRAPFCDGARLPRREIVGLQAEKIEGVDAQHVGAACYQSCR